MAALIIKTDVNLLETKNDTRGRRSYIHFDTWGHSFILE